MKPHAMLVPSIEISVYKVLGPERHMDDAMVKLRSSKPRQWIGVSGQIHVRPLGSTERARVLM